MRRFSLNTQAWMPRLRSAVVVVGIAVAAAGCGGGSVEAEVTVSAPPVSVEYLDIELTRVGPEALQIDWTDDPIAETFVVRRDGLTLARVNALTLVDASVQIGGRYCYDIAGYDRAGVLVSTSDIACITVF